MDTSHLHGRANDINPWNLKLEPQQLNLSREDRRRCQTVAKSAHLVPCNNKKLKEWPCSLIWRDHRSCQICSFQGCNVLRHPKHLIPTASSRVPQLAVEFSSRSILIAIFLVRSTAITSTTLALSSSFLCASGWLATSPA